MTETAPTRAELQQLVERAHGLQAAAPSQALELARHALRLSPDAADELTALAQVEEACALGRLGRLEQAATLAEAVLTRPAALSPRVGARALGTLGEICLLQGDTQRALALLEEALALVPADAQSDLARLLNNTGRAWFERGDHARAERAFRNAADLHFQLGERVSHAICTMNVANVRSRVGDFERALDGYRQSLALLEHEDSPSTRFMLLFNLACAYQGLDDPYPAIEMCRDALDLEGAQEHPLRGRSLLLLGNLLRRTGQLQRSKSCVAAARELIGHGGEAGMLASLAAVEGWQHLDEDRPDEARAAFERGLATLGDMEVMAPQLECRHGLARVLFATGEWAAALGMLEELLRCQGTSPDHVLRMELMTTRIEVLQASNDPLGAAAARRECGRLQRITLDEAASARLEHQKLLHALDRARTRESKLATRLHERDASLRATTRERDDLLERLQTGQRMDAIGRLAAGVAHEFNNLLTVLMAHVESLTAGGHGPREWDAAEGVRQAAERAASLTRNLVAFSSRQALQPKPVELAQAVETLLARPGLVLGDSLQVDLDLDPRAGSVRVDPAQLDELLLNLLAHARDAQPDGGWARITTRPLRVNPPGVPDTADVEPGEYICLSVVDGGPAVPRELHGRMFEPFFRARDGVRAAGLGLAAVFGIVRQSGGGVSVRSQPGQGCEIQVLLPRVSDTSVQVIDLPGPAQPASQQSLSVMLVEDEPDLRALVARGLRRLGLVVLEAQDGRAACELVERDRPELDLVISDVMMPHLDGRAMLTRMRQSCPGLRCVYTSGHREPEGGSSLPGVAWLPKPFGIAELADLARSLHASQS